jgi:hypothetical protein
MQRPGRACVRLRRRMDQLQRRQGRARWRHRRRGAAATTGRPRMPVAAATTQVRRRGRGT